MFKKPKHQTKSKQNNCIENTAKKEGAQRPLHPEGLEKEMVGWEGYVLLT